MILVTLPLVVFHQLVHHFIFAYLMFIL